MSPSEDPQGRGKYRISENMKAAAVSGVLAFGVLAALVIFEILSR
jgi:hypothetical protein